MAVRHLPPPPKKDESGVADWLIWIITLVPSIVFLIDEYFENKPEGQQKEGFIPNVTSLVLGSVGILLGLVLITALCVILAGLGSAGFGLVKIGQIVFASKISLIITIVLGTLTVIQYQRSGTRAALWLGIATLIFVLISWKDLTQLPGQLWVGVIRDLTNISAFLVDWWPVWLPILIVLTLIFRERRKQ